MDQGRADRLQRRQRPAPHGRPHRLTRPLPSPASARHRSRHHRTARYPMTTTPNPPDSTDPHPAAGPTPPQYPQQPPAYPTGPTQPPAPPAYPAQYAPPAYPSPTPQTPPPAQHVAPPVPPQPQPQPAIPPKPTTPAPLHAHHISTDQRRVYLKAHQRHADATALGSLLIYLPHFLSSLVVVSLVSLLVLGDLAFLGIVGWLLTGLLIFHRPTESTLARRLLGLRHPTREEFSRL
ncbi:peptidase, partial [Streptomyces albidoflavus]